MTDHVLITLSFKDACVAIGMSSWTLRRLINSGKVIAYKAGRRTLIDASSLSDHIKTLPQVHELKGQNNA